MKTFVLTVSRYFPATHKRKGEPTRFVEQILNGQKNDIEYSCKLHTCRVNYELWANRIKQVQEDKAILSLRFWSGKPYNSKQVEFCQLDKDSGIGVQQLVFLGARWVYPCIEPNTGISDLRTMAKNDGLSLEDFKEWFKGYDLSKPMAIIHFTKFRY